MSFELTKEQALLKKAAQQFAENTLEPTAAELASPASVCPRSTAVWAAA